MFPFLIGRIRTRTYKQVPDLDLEGFPFLIGRIRTS